MLASPSRTINRISMISLHWLTYKPMVVESLGVVKGVNDIIPNYKGMGGKCKRKRGV